MLVKETPGPPVALTAGAGRHVMNLPVKYVIPVLAGVFVRPSLNPSARRLHADGQSTLLLRSNQDSCVPLLTFA